MRFEENAADCMEPYVLGSDIDSLEMSVLFAADNVDPNIVILDGKEGFAGPFFVDKCLHRQLISEMTQEDPEIQILLDLAEELYFSLLRGETTIADALSGHFNYLRSAYYYLQQGFHAARRNNQCWVGLSSDRVIEQTLIRISQTWPSPQHKESTEARIKRDACDLEKMHTKITNCPPYTAGPTLRNIVNGNVAESDVNVHAFQEIGNNIMRDIK
ncbi:hypothetical protein DPMN_065107 [Dreissena polymorpha]|uniref:Uncharacterized protein n=1 Tax=Dreissena polymorpha TaxID=45954 RepID=A0A9D4CEE3_DREPO|nr:hypothetical protein DPMN_065107 [Dreissena polymorpha]